MASLRNIIRNTFKKMNHDSYQHEREKIQNFPRIKSPLKKQQEIHLKNKKFKVLRNFQEQTDFQILKF